jgi:hypothetical protein
MNAEIARVLRGFEIFHHPDNYDLNKGDPNGEHNTGWYFWACQPGCLPDSDPVGEFETYALALEALVDMTDLNEEPDDNDKPDFLHSMEDGVQ